MIIGLCGAARAGKDTFATLLAPDGHPLGCGRVQIARPLKAYLRDLFDWTEEHTDGDLKDVPDTRYPRTGEYGEDTYLTPRRAMQQLGGEFAEATFPSIYAVRAAREAEALSKAGYIAVVTDCRFLRDVAAIDKVGGFIVEIVREEQSDLTEDAKGHGSETARYDPAFRRYIGKTIVNDGTVADLKKKAQALYRELSSE